MTSRGAENQTRVAELVVHVAGTVGMLVGARHSYANLGDGTAVGYSVVVLARVE